MKTYYALEIIRKNLKNSLDSFSFSLALRVHYSLNIYVLP